MKKVIQEFANDDHSRFAGPMYQDQLDPLRTDGRIHEEILEAIANDPHLDRADIDFVVTDGVVTLMGSAPTRAVKRDAEICIEHISGIKDIFNQITLQEFRDTGSNGLVKHQSHHD